MSLRWLKMVYKTPFDRRKVIFALVCFNLFAHCSMSFDCVIILQKVSNDFKNKNQHHISFYMESLSKYISIYSFTSISQPNIAHHILSRIYIQCAVSGYIETHLCTLTWLVINLCYRMIRISYHHQSTKQNTLWITTTSHQHQHSNKNGNEQKNPTSGIYYVVLSHNKICFIKQHGSILKSNVWHDNSK